MQFIRGSMLLGLALSALAVAACAKGDRYTETGATLEGTVTYKGKQVGYARVVAAGGQGGSGSASADIGDDGRYKLENVPLGEVKLAVITAAGQGAFMAREKYSGPGERKAKRASMEFISVPPPYDNPEMSGLKTTINKGANTFDIKIPPGK